MPNAETHAWGEFAVGTEAGFDVTLTQEIVDEFAKLSGDHNPLHAVEHVPHGMIAGMLFSRLLGMHLPGLNCLYLSQTLNFRQRMPLNTPLRVSGHITNTSDATHTLTIVTRVTSGDTTLVEGEALVRAI